MNLLYTLSVNAKSKFRRHEERHWSENRMCICALSHVRLFVTPWAVACQAPHFMGFFREEHWSGLPCPPPGDLPDPGIETVSLTSPALAGRFFTTSATWEAQNRNRKVLFEPN